MTWGLWVFIIVHVLNLIGLLFDYVLYSKGLPTISYHVEHNPAWGVPIILAQIASIAGITAHLYGKY